MKRFKVSLAVLLLAHVFGAIFFAAHQTCRAEGLETVSVQLRWKHQFQFAGYYAALAKGYYAEEGLDVVLREKVPGTAPYSEVITGTADYGIADAGLLYQRLTGKPVVLLTQIFQHSPLIFISRQESGIISPYEMAGKIVMYEPDRDSAPLEGMLADSLSTEVLGQIRQVPHSMNYDDLVSGKVDVISAYLTDQPFRLKRQGVAVNIINPQNYGIDFYGDNLFTSEAELYNHPGRADKMIRATLKGWQYALEHSDEVIDLILASYNSQGLDREFLEYEARMTKMMIMADLVPLGQVNQGRYRRVAQIYQHLGIIKEALVPEGFIYHRPVVELSAAEQSWLRDHPRIVLGSNEENKPYIQVDKDGVVRGFAVDYLKLLREKTGVNISLAVGRGVDIVAQAARRELDGLSLVTRWDAHENNLLFSAPIHEGYKMIFAPVASQLKINSLSDLKGLRVGIRSWAASERGLLHDIPGVKVVEADSTPEQIKLLAAGEIDVFMGAVSVHNYLQKHTLSTIQAIYTITEEIPAYGFAVRNDWPELQSIINKGLAAITEEERAAILQKWTRLAELDTGKKKLILTEAEKRWLGKHSEIRIAVDPGWPPIEFVNSQGEYSGITSEIVARAANELGVTMTLEPTENWAETMAAARAGKVDVVPALVDLPVRHAFALFSKPYLEFPVVIVAHEDSPYVGGMADLADKQVAVVDQFSVAAQLKDEYPDYSFVAYPDVSSALTALTQQKVDVFVVDTASVSYALKRREFAKLKVVAPTSYTYPLSFGVRKDWPELVAILDKFIDAIPAEEKQAIEKSWLNLQVEREVDWRTVSWIVTVVGGVGGFIVLVFVLWNRRLRLEVDRRRQAEDGLQQYQRQLERLVAERTADLAASNEQLQASERKFKGIFHNTYQFIGLLNTQGVLLECNDTSLAFIGKEAEEVVGRLFWETPWWNDSPQLQEDLQGYIRRAAAGELVTVDVIHKDLQGKAHYVNFSLKPILDEEGRVTFLVAEGRDISQQKLSELRFRTLFNTASDAILIMQEDRFVQCNAKALEIFGCDYAQLLEASPDKFSPPYQPDGRESRESALEKIKAAYEGELLTFEWQHCRCDGTPFDAEVSLNVAELEGEKFLQAIVRDITGRKNSEKQLSRLASAIEQAAEAIVITDTEGIIEYVNPAFEKISGYSRAEAIGQTPALVKSGEQDQAFYENLWNTISSGQVWKGRFTNRSKAGALFVEDATISPVFNSRNENMGYVAVKRDMTQQIKLESDLRQAQKMEAIGTLAGGIAHDFNNILTAIFGYNELAFMHLGDTEKVRADLGQVHTAAERARDLVKQILTFSRKSEQVKRPLQIAPLIKEVVKLLRSSLPSTIEIKQQIRETDKSVLADPTQIHQVLMNLCTNAYHAMRTTGGVLAVALQEKSVAGRDPVLSGELQPGEYLEIEISDTGVGMDATTREKIFEPYFTTKKSGEGTGLGLAVVHGIVQDHQGMIHVYSEPGQGSTFRVYLPTLSAGAAEGGHQEEEVRPDGRQRSLMVVDDEESILGIAREFLVSYGYLVTTFKNPSEALEAFRQEPAAYELMITDMTMPGMTGVELAAKVLALQPGFPVILCTGYSELINRDKALALGIREYVVKPLEIRKLAARIEEILAEGSP